MSSQMQDSAWKANNSVRASAVQLQVKCDFLFGNFCGVGSLSVKTLYRKIEQAYVNTPCIRSYKLTTYSADLTRKGMQQTWSLNFKEIGKWKVTQTLEFVQVA